LVGLPDGVPEHRLSSSLERIKSPCSRNIRASPASAWTRRGGNKQTRSLSNEALHHPARRSLCYHPQRDSLRRNLPPRIRRSLWITRQRCLLRRAERSPHSRFLDLRFPTSLSLHRGCPASDWVELACVWNVLAVDLCGEDDLYAGDG